MSLWLLFKSAPFYIKLYENEGKVPKTRKEIGSGDMWDYHWIRRFSQAKLIIKKKEGRELKVTFTKKGKLFYQKLKKIVEMIGQSPLPKS